MEQVFIQYILLHLDPAYRRLDDATREQGRADFAAAVHSSGIRTYSYGMTGLKAQCDLMLWRIDPSLEKLQENTASLLKTGIGRYMTISHVMTGMTRPSVYVKKHTSQEQAMFEMDRQKYLVVYPFVKTADWYLMSREARQGMMNEHMRVGHEYPSVRQLLAYSFGMDDQEFIVAYEMDELEVFVELVMALRNTEGRRYTLRDTPLYTGIYRSIEDNLLLTA